VIGSRAWSRIIHGSRRFVASLVEFDNIGNLSLDLALDSAHAVAPDSVFPAAFVAAWPYTAVCHFLGTGLTENYRYIKLCLHN
jgi:hypothetical protein